MTNPTSLSKRSWYPSRTSESCEKVSPHCLLDLHETDPPVVLEDHEITCVINISRSRAPDTNDADYASRRAAVDFGIPVSLPIKVIH